MMLRRKLRVFLMAAMLALPALSAQAVNPSEILPDPAQEHRAREISKNLRCLVCQNQSIDDSDADLARDLRVIVRERIRAGDTDDQVTEYVVARYGDYVLLKPPFKVKTLALWLGPVLIFVAGFGFALSYYRRRRAEATPPAPLTESERNRIAALLKDDGTP